MKSTAILAFGILILASSIHGANWCTHGFCKRCSYVIGTTEHKSCLSCGNGVYSSVSEGSVAGFECKQSNTIANCEADFKRDADSTTITCMQCKEGHFPNDTDTLCTPVTTKIENCVYYSTATTCSTCKEGYFKTSSSTVCTKAPEIPNCERYSGSNDVSYCTRCKSGHYVATLGTTCAKVTTEILNCENHYSMDGTTMLCNECKRDFIGNENSTACVSEPRGCGSVTQTECRCRDRYWAVDHLGAAGDKCEFSTRVLGYVSVIALALTSFFN